MALQESVYIALDYRIIISFPTGIFFIAMWSRQRMMRLIIYYVQLDTHDIHDKNMKQCKQYKYDVMNVYIICTDKTILKYL